jgi:hypothetical protein
MNWKEEYIQMLAAIDPNDDEILAALELKMANLPLNLYKYRQPDEFAIESIRNDTVWVSRPMKFEDAFEFAEYLDPSKLSKSMDKILDTEIALLSTGRNKMPINIIRKIKTRRRLVKWVGFLIPPLRRIYERMWGEGILVMQRGIIESMQDKMKVCSFCESPNNIKMWEEYAKSHTGFCIEYEISRWREDDIRRKILHPVVYTDDLYDSTDHYTHHALNSRFNFMFPVISGTRKKKQYEYENEWRLIIQAGGSFLEQNYPMNCQSRVYIGYRMESIYKARIIEICRKRGLAVYQEILSTKTQELTFEPLTLNK